MRRIGNRLQLAIMRWKRDARTTELLRFRQRWAKKFGEYECVGGPHDGRVVHAGPTLEWFDEVPCPKTGGTYELDASDCRLHYHEPARRHA
jgi:hypothetical protein